MGAAPLLLIARILCPDKTHGAKRRPLPLQPRFPARAAHGKHRPTCKLRPRDLPGLSLHLYPPLALARDPVPRITFQQATGACMYRRTDLKTRPEHLHPVDRHRHFPLCLPGLFQMHDHRPRSQSIQPGQSCTMHAFRHKHIEHPQHDPLCLHSCHNHRCLNLRRDLASRDPRRCSLRFSMCLHRAQQTREHHVPPIQVQP